ncbi:MAG: hypothetical protein IPK64_10950 [bacterium]|nr:hypothetical protein [bacterium]
MAPDDIEGLRARYATLRGYWRDHGPQAELDWHGAGIYDPDLGQCVTQHYALSHLVLAAALLHELTGEAGYGDNAARMAALLARHQAGRYRPFEPNSIHWDFNNFAWLNVALLPASSELRRLLADPSLDGLAHENGTWAGNWLTMRQVNSTLRRRLGLRNRSWRLGPEVLLWQRLFRRDGGIDEFPGRSRPLQYHAYVLALMLRRFVATGDLSSLDERRLHDGVGFLLGHVDACGRANYRGRGQYQLFGEGCLRYVLAVMAAWHERADARGACAEALARIQGQVWPERPDGLLALVGTDPAGERRGSHYDYHHVTVYNAFDLAWRLLALHDARTIASLRPPRRPAPGPAAGLLADSGIWLHRAGPWLVALAAGEEMFLSDVGLTFCHIGGPRGVLFTAPGGPHPSRYGKMHGHDGLRANVFGPLLVGPDGTGLPHFQRGSLRRDGDGVRARVSAGTARLDRLVRVDGKTLAVTDTAVFPAAAPVRHIFHWAVPAALALHSAAPGTWTVGRAGESPLAALRFAGAAPTLARGEPFRGPGGLVRPWFIEAGAGPAEITFTLELFE